MTMFALVPNSVARKANAAVTDEERALAVSDAGNCANLWIAFAHVQL